MKRRIDMEFVTCPGSRIHTRYESRFTGSGIELVEAGTTDIQQEIESYGKYTDLHFMLHRLSVGDRNVLTKRPPMYGDFSSMPTNPVDAINLMHSAERRFTEMSLEERSAYNNDYRTWLATVLSGQAVSGSTVSPVVPADPGVKENKVKENEDK